MRTTKKAKPDQAHVAKRYAIDGPLWRSMVKGYAACVLMGEALHDWRRGRRRLANRKRSVALGAMMQATREMLGDALEPWA